MKEAPRHFPGMHRRPRSWPVATGLALVLVAALVAASATINPLLGRYVHWHRILVGTPPALATLAVALRRRWL